MNANINIKEFKIIVKAQNNNSPVLNFYLTNLQVQLN